MKWSIMVAALALILLIFGFILVRPYLWFRVSPEAASIDGEKPSDVEIYVSSSGETLLRNGGPGGYEDYIIRKQQQELGIPNSNNFIPLLFCVFSKEISPPIVASTNRVKIERDISVDFQPDWVEFTTSAGKRLRIDFRKLTD